LTPTALTIRNQNGGIGRVLYTNIDVHIGGTIHCINVTAIWDTGATGTSITSSVVRRLGLTPTGGTNVSTANGVVFQNTYTIDVGLPNGVIIRGIVATEVSSLAGADALIGMDIITLGDFSITNHNGNTCMSFRIPSLHEIDYVTNLYAGVKMSVPVDARGSKYTSSKKKRRK
jgi:hypothetical protein